MFPFSKFNNRIWFQSSLHRKATSAFHSDEELDGMCLVLGAAPSPRCSSSPGQPCCLGLRDRGTWAFLTSAAGGRKGKGGRRKAKKKAFFIRLKRGRKHSSSKLKNPENSENLENFEGAGFWITTVHALRHVYIQSQHSHYALHDLDIWPCLFTLTEEDIPTIAIWTRSSKRTWEQFTSQSQAVGMTTRYSKVRRRKNSAPKLLLSEHLSRFR